MTKKKRPPREKLDIVCGEGKHRSWNTAVAELVMLTKYGALPDYFWREPQFKDEFIKLIKFVARIGKKVGQNRLAFVLSKEKFKDFEKEVGLIVYECQNLKYEPTFTLENLVTQFKNKYRAKEQPIIEVKETKIEVKKNQPGLLDLLGDI